MQFNRVILRLALSVAVAGCASPRSRQLDPAHAGESWRPEMRFRYEQGVSDRSLLDKLRPGDIIAFSSGEDSGGSSTAFGIALTQVSHVGILVPYSLGRRLLVLTANSEDGVLVNSVERTVGDRDFYVFAFPEGLIDLNRLHLFSERAIFLGRLDYDWSAIFGWNTNLTPNTVPEIGDEHTCASCVAAALHFSGLSLDSAWSGVVTPGDIITSVARRNLNWPRPPGQNRQRGPAGEDRDDEESWEDPRR